jgi:EAL domain-containing protein (putative c-di-GMP-specific phosphodiesterase class I)
LEVDGAGVVRSALGAARGLTRRDATELVGRPLLDLFAPEEQVPIAETLGGLESGGRLPIMTVRLDGSERPVLFGGCRIESEDAIYVTLTAARLAFAASAAGAVRDAGTGLIAAEDFGRIAAECLESARQVGQAARLTVLEMPGLGELRSRLGPVPYSDLLARIGGLLRGRSLGGDAAGALRDGRYAVMHADAVSGRSLVQAIALIAGSEDAGALEVRQQTIDLSSTQFTPDDARQALVYTIRRFVDAPVGEIEIHSLGESLDGLMSETVLRIRSLRETVKRGGFKLAFQPIVELGSGLVHHYEVLSRFEGGESPFRVVTFAEEVGVIHDFDLAVCQRAIDLLRDADGRGAVADLAVNFSARSLDADLFVGALRTMLVPLGPLRRQLLFEVTESTSIRDLPRAARILEQLRVDGHPVCLDDFGAGAASLPYLQALPLDYVKIDGSYVREMLANQRDAAILKSIARLCRDLSIGCIAEMIESQGQADKLARLGVRYGQGFHFGRPKPETPAPGARIFTSPAR